MEPIPQVLDIPLFLSNDYTWVI